MAGDTVRIHAPRRVVLARFGYVLPGLVVMPIQATLLAETWMWVGWGALALLLGLLLAYELWRPPCLSLREDAAVVVRPFRSREVPWRDVQAITMVTWFGGTTLHLADGTTVSAAYPSRSILARRRVESDYDRVGQWWLAHRGPDWRPVALPPAPPPPPPPSAHPGATSPSLPSGRLPGGARSPRTAPPPGRSR